MVDSILDVVQLYKVPIFLGGGSVFVIIICLVLLVKSIQTATPIQFSSEHAVALEASGAAQRNVLGVTVDVEGAVLHPGVYQLAKDARVDDAIAAAGGVTTSADGELLAKTINRASKVVDGGKIYVPVADIHDTSHNQTLYQRDDASYNISPLLQRPSGPSQNSDPISVNFASESQLESLPGVGPATAAKIIANRPYQTLEELVSKKAIGPSLFEKLKNNLSL